MKLIIKTLEKLAKIAKSSTRISLFSFLAVFPARITLPMRATIPVRSASPMRATIPVRPASPFRAKIPVRPTSPFRTVFPIRYASPFRTVFPIRTIFPFFILIPFLIIVAFSASSLAQSLTIYSGRSKALVEPLIQKFEQEYGIRMNVRYGSSTQLAVALLEEGRRTPADVFWAQDAGALGAVHRNNMFEKLPDELLEQLPDQLRNSEGTWVATSGRARVMAWSTQRVDTTRLPGSIFGLVDPHWRGRVGWAPGNGSFQSMVTSMRLLEGDDTILKWLRDMRENNTQAYINNSALLQAIAAGEIDIALTNHYYLFRFRQTTPGFPVDQSWFSSGDPGNLVNVAGIGMLKNARNQSEAVAFINFLLKEENQQWVTKEVFEYPVIDAAVTVPVPIPLRTIQELSPDLDLDDLSDLNQTLILLRQAGLL